MNAGTGLVGGVAVGKTKMSLDADEDEEKPLLASSQTGSQAHSKKSAAGSGSSSQDDLAGPIVTGVHTHLLTLPCYMWPCYTISSCSTSLYS